MCLTHVKKNLQNKLGKKTTFQNNVPSMIPLEKAQTLLKPDNIMLRDTHIADGVRRIKKNRWIIKIKMHGSDSLGAGRGQCREM